MLFCLGGTIYAIYFTENISFKSNDSGEKRMEDISKHYIPEEDNGVCYEYYQNEDGKWCVNGRKYDERLVVKGRLPMASCESEYVVLSNDKTISFEEIAKSIYSNNNADALKIEKSCIVEIR